MKKLLVILLCILMSMTFALQSFATEGVLHDATEIENTSLKNARRTPTGILMMGIRAEGEATSWQAEQIANELWDEGIRMILSLHPPDSDITQAFHDRGIVLLHEQFETRYENYWNFHWWLGYDVPWQDAVEWMMQQYEPDQIAIHCQHGVDRAGNTMAYILSVYFDVPIADAWYAVVDPSYQNVEGLADVLEEFGINDRRSYDDPTVGIYAFNRVDGMKAHNEGYRNYIRNTIQEALNHGANPGPLIIH